MEAREFMRDQRRQQQQQQESPKIETYGDAIGFLCGLIGVGAFFYIFLTQLDLILAFSVLFICFFGGIWIGVCIDNKEEKAKKMNKSGKISNSKNEKPRKKEQYHDDTI